MPDFRLYSLKPSGEVELPPEDFFATSDEAALAYAARQDCPYGCEVWSRDRLVAAVKPPAEAAGEARSSALRRLVRFASFERRA